MISVKEGTRAEVMAAVWKLVKVAGAQDKDDGSVLRPIGGFEKASCHLIDSADARSSQVTLCPSTSCLSLSRDSFLTPNPSSSHTQ
jgi:hypothetical protein